MAEDELDKLDEEIKSEGGEADAAQADPLFDEGGKKKKLILIGGLAAVLLIGGAGAYFTGALDGLLGKGEAETQTEAVAVDKEGKPLNSVFLPIPDMIVNLSSNESTPRYLRLSVQLELKNELDKARVEAVMPRVIDQFQTYLRELRVRDLRGSAGIYRLQIELLSRVNEAAYPVVVEDVLFQEILIQ